MTCRIYAVYTKLSEGNKVVVRKRTRELEKRLRASTPQTRVHRRLPFWDERWSEMPWGVRQRLKSRLMGWLPMPKAMYYQNAVSLQAAFLLNKGLLTVIAELNDRFRKGDTSLGQYMMTQGVQALPQELQQQLIQLVRDFDSFTPENDPYGERDFGKVALDDDEYFFKIEYYDPTLTHHSEDPASPNATRRVLMLMLADEY